MEQYKTWKIPSIGEKPIWVIVDESGNIINNNPTKEELKGLEVEPYTRNIVPRYYN